MKRNQPSSIPYIIRCKDCVRRFTDDCPMLFEEYPFLYDNDDDHDDRYESVIHDRTEDMGYCYLGQIETGYPEE